MNMQQIATKPQNAQEVIAMMGKAYLCHPANQVKRKTPFRRTAKQLRAALGTGGA